MAAKSEPTKAVTVKMTHTKTTKNFEMYAATKGAHIENVYVAKGAFEEVPTNITVTIAVNGK